VTHLKNINIRISAVRIAITQRKSEHRRFAPSWRQTMQWSDNKPPIDYQYRQMKPYRCIT